MNILKYLSEFKIILSLDNFIMFILVSAIICGFIFIIYKIIKICIFKKCEMVEMNINIANIGNIKLNINKRVSNIAHKVWVEVMTRKAGLKFERENDLIIEVYNSWYVLFGELRILLKSIDVNDKNSDVDILIRIILKVMNNGLRPHLTKWQAKYRKWYYEEVLKEENKGKTPQEIQKNYYKYNELVEDLIKTNDQIIQFTNELEKII